MLNSVKPFGVNRCEKSDICQLLILADFGAGAGAELAPLKFNFGVTLAVALGITLV